jgi:hypothetical protein
MQIDERSLVLLVENLAGLSVADTERLARQAVLDDGALASSDLPAIMEAKYSLLNRNGVLGYEHDTARYADVGGLRRIKEWLAQRRSAFDGSTPQLDRPKGVLLLGVQGCGKSLAARAAAGVFACRCCAWISARCTTSITASPSATCAITQDRGDHGAVRAVDRRDREGPRDRRWRQRHVAARAGHVSDLARREALGGLRRRHRRTTSGALPPELVRKGRFDEIFFVDLPRDAVREEILRIHLARRKLQIGEPEVRALAHAADGFSGGELEQVVVSRHLCCERRRPAAIGAPSARRKSAQRVPSRSLWPSTWRSCASGRRDGRGTCGLKIRVSVVRFRP